MSHAKKKHLFNIFVGELEKYLDQKTLEIVIPARSDVNHRIRKVLRLRPGEFLRVFDYTKALETTVVSIGKNVVLSVLKELEKPSSTPLVLYSGIGAKTDWEYVVRAAVSFGVFSVTFFTGEKRYLDSRRKFLQRASRVAISAMEQSGNLSSPAIDIVGEDSAYEKFLSSAEGNRFVLDGAGVPVQEVIMRTKEDSTRRPVSLIVGPPEGLDPDFILQAKNTGAHITAFKAYTLKSELASVAAISLFSQFLSV